MKVNCWYFYYNIYFYIFIVFYFEDQYLPISATLTNATIKDQGGHRTAINWFPVFQNFQSPDQSGCPHPFMKINP